MCARRAARRFASLAVAAALVAGGCAAGAADLDEQRGAGMGALVEAPPPSTTVPSTTTPPTTTAPSDPWEVITAVARPDVEVLETFDAPDGKPVDFDFSLTNPTYWGTELALMVTSGSVGDEWLEVQLPVRPNGSEAWIRASNVDLFTHRFRAELRLGTRELVVWEGDEVVARTSAVVGKPATPTPTGRFYINDRLPRADRDGPYGPWILTLSAFSEALDTFNGGLPVIAIHGTNRPELVGQERSNGCIRVPNDVIERLAALVPLGTPVDVYA